MSTEKLEASVKEIEGVTTQAATEKKPGSKGGKKEKKTPKTTSAERMAKMRNKNKVEKPVAPPEIDKPTGLKVSLGLLQ